MAMAEVDDILAERVSALRDVIARIPGGIDGLSCGDSGDVVELVSIAQSVILSAQGVLAAGAGEISRRSAGSNETSLARQLGERSARGLVASRAGLTFGQAGQYVAVGEMIRPNLALSGEALPADREHIAEAVLAGRMLLPVAELIDETVHTLEAKLVRDGAAELEATLVQQWLTGEYSVKQFTRQCARVVQLLDPDGVKPRNEDLRSKAYIRETWLDSGMLKIVAELDPEWGAFYLASMRAKTNPHRPAPADEPAEPAEPEAKRVPGEPSRMEAKVAAFTRIMRDGLQHEVGDQAGVDTTILVRIDLDSLLSGIGAATIDGIAQPIPASAARRLAAEADLIPQVFGGKSQLLDQGESRRRFTKAQRYAILAGYVGCAFPRCDIPSSMVEFHHIGQWATRHSHGKGTDIENGLPLCGFHNRLMEQGWDIVLDDDRVPWFIPPATVDVHRRPLRGGNVAHPDSA
jgi:hypothetical protein